MTSQSHRWRWLPQPLLSLMLWLVWLMLNHSVAVGHLVLGAGIAWFIPFVIQPMMDPQPPLLKPWVALRYFLRLVGDILVSNLLVAIQVMGPIKKIHPGFVAFPLQLTQDLPITILACTISLTPGTVSAELSEDRRWLYIHALNLTDETELVNTIKTRYEKPLREMFGC